MNPNNCKPANAQLWAEPNARFTATIESN